MPPRRLRPAAALFVLPLFALALIAPRCGTVPSETSVLAGALAARGHCFERFETAGNVWGPFTNRFDPAQVRLDGEFVAPDGSTLVIPGFYMQDFTRALVGGYEHLTPRGQAQWRVRMTPTQPGVWQWRWVATTPARSGCAH